MIDKRVDHMRGLASSAQALGRITSVFATVIYRNPDFERTWSVDDADAVPVKFSARLSLPVMDGGGQQFSCRCCARHGQLESPKAQDSTSSLNRLRDLLVL
jgi:hypothetical protein